MSRLIISIFRRGAAAMTNEIVPSQSEAGVSYFDDYRTARRFPFAHAAAVNTQLLDGQKGYGVNKRFTAFLNGWKHPTYRSAAFVTLGTTAPTRSHFYEQGRIDCGGVNYNFANSGYMNRFAGLFPPAVASTLDILSIGGAACRMTIGNSATYAATQSVVPLLSATAVSRAKAFMTASAPDSNAVEVITGRNLASAMLETNIGLSTLPVPTNLPSNTNAGAPDYPKDVTGKYTSWSNKMRDCVRMIAAGIPSRFICVDFDGWDHHSDMGGSIDSPSGARNHAAMLAEMNDALLAMIYDLTELGHINRTMIVTQTEFHRTARENGNFGADHGQSSHAYVWGPTVNSDLYGAPLDYRENNATTYADSGPWSSPFPNRLLNHTMEYRDYQRMQCEWLLERQMTPAEVASVWGVGFTSAMTPAQRLAIPIN